MHKIFLSHTWQLDEEDRNTHERVLKVQESLQKLGLNTWLDEENMIHDLDGSMVRGIDDCTIIAIFLTKKYCDKVNRAAYDPHYIDNCYKECTYAYNSQKPCIPVIFESCMHDSKKWKPGLIKFYFGNRLYINGTKDNYDTIANDIIKIISRTSERSLKVNPTPKKTKKSFIYYADDTNDTDDKHKVNKTENSNDSNGNKGSKSILPSVKSPVVSPIRTTMRTINNMRRSPVISSKIYPDTSILQNIEQLKLPRRKAPVLKHNKYSQTESKNINCVIN